MNLAAQIDDHRHLYRQDTYIDRLVARQPPTSLDLNTGELHVEPGAAVGMPMSGRLLKYLGHPEAFGSDFPWSKALWLLRRECRAKHPHHRGANEPYWRGSLCHQAVTFVVVRGWSVENTAKILRYDDPAPVLRWSFDYMERQIDELRRKAERRERENAGRFSVSDYPTHHHHSVPGLHKQECPQCQRAA